ncbi:MAG: adenosylcobinamide-GDP ribazoletransferase [Haliea sp.]|nr:adenosylcobinamide-GDP ribazoletransferase [Haliea sp.]
MRRRLRQEWRALLLAIGLLTRVPIPAIGSCDSRTVGLSLHWYPVAGLLIALPLVAVAALTQSSPPLAAALVLCAWVALTGALHLDGLADCADAWVGGMGDRERTLAIMRDPASGPVAVTALVLLLLLKWTALTVIIAAPLDTGWWLIPVLARLAVVLAFISTPYVRPGGMGDGLGEQRSPCAIAVVGAASALAALLLTPARIGGLWLVAASLLFWCWRRAMRRRLGGFTGDGAGALVELLEAALLVVTALAAGGVAS